MKVIFITGLGRSGTNLLDLLLDAHSQVCGLGEIQRLASAYKYQHKKCSCGASNLRDCEFWPQVNQVLKQRLGREISSLNLESRDTDTFNQDNRIFFESVAQVSGTRYITDNSKTPRRLRRLLVAPDIDVVPVQVERDPRGCAHSQYKRKKMHIGPSFTYTFRYLNLYRLLRNREHIVIQYEQLAQDPERVLRQLMHRLDLKFEPELLSWAEQVHHNIGSANNVLRKTEGSSIRPDNAWQKSVPGYKQAIINFITWPARMLNRIKNRRWGLSS